MTSPERTNPQVRFEKALAKHLADERRQYEEWRAKRLRQEHRAVETPEPLL